MRILYVSVAEGHDASSAQEASTPQWNAPTPGNFWVLLLRPHEFLVLGPLAISFQPRQFATLPANPEVHWGFDAFETAVGGEEKKLRRHWLREHLAEDRGHSRTDVIRRQEQGGTLAHAVQRIEPGGNNKDRGKAWNGIKVWFVDGLEKPFLIAGAQVILFLWFRLETLPLIPFFI